MNKQKMQNQKGAVSIFVVVFSALFVTIITVSFVGLMIRGQQQATNADLSNSAYDAALAGVEDAKRMLLKYRQCISTSSTSVECNDLRAMFTNPECNMVKRSINGGLSTDTTETLIQSSDGTDVTSQALDQAYTCVKVNYTADDKELQVPDGESVLVPIESNGVSYNRINISWFTRDLQNPQLLSLPSDPAVSLPQKAAWMPADTTYTRPPILRAQWIQHSGTFNATDFDSDRTENFEPEPRANAKTVFLYPHIAGTGDTTFNIEDNRSTAAGVSVKDPTQIRCNGDYNNGQYACSVNIDLPVPISNSGSRTGYLQLGALYNSTKVKISLLSGATPVQIVAPTVDSTGRANDLFRRVKVGVSFTGEYPRAGFDINGNLCKDFSVSTDTFFQGTCNPNNPNNL